MERNRRKKYLLKMKILRLDRRIFLCGNKLKFFKFQPVAHIHAKGEQGNGHFGHYAGVVILDEGVVAPNIDHSTKHIGPPLKNRPGFPGRSLVFGSVRN